MDLTNQPVDKNTIKQKIQKTHAYTLAEVKEELLGAIGTFDRDAYDQKVRNLILQLKVDKVLKRKK